MKKVSIVIPTFNEEKNIENVIHSSFTNLKRLKLDSEIVVIDDSKDKTYDILKQLMNRYKNLKAIHRTNGKGVGSAIRHGIDEAKGQFVIVFMADAPDDVKYFSSIIEKLESGYDLVQTSRFIEGSKMIRYPLKKRIFNWICNNFIKLVFLEFKLKDFSSLFKGFNTDRIRKLNLSANEFDLGLEIALKSMRKKYRITEVPVDWEEREKGESKLKLSRYARHYFTRVIGTWLTYW